MKYEIKGIERNEENNEGWPMKKNEACSKVKRDCSIRILFFPLGLPSLKDKSTRRPQCTRFFFIFIKKAQNPWSKQALNGLWTQNGCWNWHACSKSASTCVLYISMTHPCQVQMSEEKNVNHRGRPPHLAS